MNHEQYVDEMTTAGLGAAYRAVDSYVERDEFLNDICADAGIAIELTVKAALLEFSPILIIDKGFNDEALKCLSGIREFPDQLPFSTVGFEFALHRMKWVYPTFPYDVGRDQELVRNRNAAVHSGIVARGAPEKSIRIMVRLLEWTWSNVVAGRLRKKGIRVDSVPWPRHEDVVARLQQDDSTDLTNRVLGRIEDARKKFEYRYRGMDVAHTATLFSALSRQVLDDMKENSGLGELREFVVPQECPACHNIGGAEFEVLTEDRIYSTDGLDTLVIENPVPRAESSAFSCQICGLHLWRAEMGIAGIEPPATVPWSE